MRYSRTGTLVGPGGGSNFLWYWPPDAARPLPLLDFSGQPAFGGGARIRDNNTIVAQMRSGQTWSMVEWIGNPPIPTPLDPQGASFVSAGGGNWLATLSSAGFHSRGSIAGQEFHEDVMCLEMGIDGAYALSDLASAPVAYSAAGVQTAVLPANVQPSLVSIRDGWCFYGDGRSGVFLASMRDGSLFPIKPLPGPAWPGMPFTVDGVLWLVYYTAGFGLVCHEATDPSQGYTLVPAGTDAYSPDVWVRNGAVELAYATTAGEPAADARRHLFPQFGRGMTPFTPRPADVPSTPPPAPVPVPPPTPVPADPGGPMPSIPDTELQAVFAFLQSVRGTYPPAMSDDQCVEMLNRVAWHTVGGWGLLSKPSGHNGRRADGALCSVDYLVHIGSLTGFDCLTDAGTGGASSPTLGGQETFTADRIVAAIAPVAAAPGTGTPDPPPPPAPVPTPDPSGTDLTSRLDRIEQKLDLAATQYAALVQALGQLAGDIHVSLAAQLQQLQATADAGYQGSGTIKLLGMASVVHFDLTPKPRP